MTDFIFKRVMRTQANVSKLRAWRNRQRLTLQEVADLTGLSVAMLSRAERGERFLSPIAKVTLARCLDARVADLFDPGLDHETVAALQEMAELRGPPGEESPLNALRQ